MTKRRMRATFARLVLKRKRKPATRGGSRRRCGGMEEREGDALNTADPNRAPFTGACPDDEKSVMPAVVRRIQMRPGS